MATPTRTKPVLAILREMAVGESQAFPLARRAYVSAVASRFGVEWSKTFTTSTDRQAKTVTITRTA